MEAEVDGALVRVRVLHARTHALQRVRALAAELTAMRAAARSIFAVSA